MPLQPEDRRRQQQIKGWLICALPSTIPLPGDLVLPRCLGALKDHFDIIFRPFFRDATLPDESVPLQQRLESALGSEDTERLKDHVVRFTFEGMIGSTNAAYRLAHAIGNMQLRRALIAQLYFRWFEVGADIIARQFLVECAAIAGLSKKTKHWRPYMPRKWTSYSRSTCKVH